jgi:hypothetical protein
MESPDALAESAITGKSVGVDECPGTGSGTEGSATIGAGTAKESPAWDASLTGAR